MLSDSFLGRQTAWELPRSQGRWHQCRLWRAAKYPLASGMEGLTAQFWVYQRILPAIIPRKLTVLASHFIQGSCNLSTVRNESLKNVCKSQETSNLAHRFRNRPISHSLQLFRVRCYGSTGDDMPEIEHFKGSNQTFGWLAVKLMSANGIQNVMYMF